MAVSKGELPQSSDAQMLFQGAKQRHINRNTTVYYAEDTADRLYRVNSGLVTLEREGLTGSVAILDIAKEGNVIGFEAFGPDREYRSTAIAREDTKIDVITKKQLQILLDTNPGLANYLLSEAILLNQRMFDHIESLSLYPGRERIARAIQEFANKSGVLDVTQETIAQRAGVTRVHVNRTIAFYRGKNVIAPAVSEGRSGVRILDPRRLQLAGDGLVR